MSYQSTFRDDDEDKEHFRSEPSHEASSSGSLQTASWDRNIINAEDESGGKNKLFILLIVLILLLIGGTFYFHQNTTESDKKQQININKDQEHEDSLTQKQVRSKNTRQKPNSQLTNGKMGVEIYENKKQTQNIPDSFSAHSKQLEKKFVKKNYTKYERAEKVQKLQIPHFQCKMQNFLSWEKQKTQSYLTKDKLKLQKVPYPELTIVQNQKSPSPDYHYTELVTFLKQNPPKKSIYIHSASVYAVLLIAAATSSNISVTIAHDYPQKQLVLTSLVLNNIRDKAYFEQQSEAIQNIQKADLIVTASPDFIKILMNAKPALLIVQKETFNPDTSSLKKLSQSQFCSPIKEIPEERNKIDKGIYGIQLDVFKNNSHSVIEQKQKSKQIQKQTISSRVVKKRKYQNYEKAEKVQKLQIEDFRCDENQITTWTQAKTKTYITKDGLKLQKVPYSSLVLLLNQNDTSPTHHYSETVTYCRQYPPNKAVYVHSAPVYLVLLIAASTSSDISIIISHSYPEKYLVLTSFVLNNIREKAYFEDEDQQKQSIQNSDFIVTSSSSFIKTISTPKTVLLTVEKSAENPQRGKVQKVEEKEPCSPVKLIEDPRQKLSQGLYKINMQ